MTWIVDGVPLSTMAFNVINRSAGWKVPAKRGENLIIPGRSGARWLPNKSFDQGSLSLNMWAIGAKEDGTLPRLFGANPGDPVEGTAWDFDLARQARNNLDKLTALFSKTSSLMEVVQITGSAYGLSNIATNPNFSTVSPDTYFTYPNLILNPAMRKNAPRPQVSNIFPNPDLVTIPENFQPNFENLALDPSNKWGRTAAQTIVAVNQTTPQTFEGYTVGEIPGTWTSAANVTHDVFGNNTADQAANPTGGVKVLRITANAALASGAMIAWRNFAGINVGAVPTTRLRVRRGGAVQVTRTLRVRIVTRNAASVVLQTGPWKSLALATTGWYDFTYGPDDFGLGPNPAAVAAQVEFSTGDAWAANDAIVLDQHILFSHPPAYLSGPFSNTPAPYFDGDSIWAATSWNSTPDRSASTMKVTPDSRWTAVAPTSTTNAFFAFTDRPASDLNGVGMGFIAHGVVAGGTQAFVTDLAAPNPGTPYTVRYNARALAGAVCTVELLKMGLADSDYISVGTSTFTGTGSAITTGSRMSGSITVGLTNSYTAVSGDLLRLRITVPVRIDGQHVFQYTGMAVTNATNRFDGGGPGGSVDTVNIHHRWAGEPWNSKSIQDMRRINRLDPTTRAVQVTTNTPAGSAFPLPMAEVVCQADGFPTLMSLENTPLPAVNRGLHVRAEVAGGIYTDALGTANPIARLDVSVLDSSAAPLNTWSSAPVTTNLLIGGTGAFLPLSVRVPAELIPANATHVRVTVVMTNPVRATTLYAYRFAILDTSVPPAILDVQDFFTGGTDVTSWAATPNDSASIWKAGSAAGYTIPEGIAGPGDVVAMSAISTSAAAVVSIAHPMSPAAAAGDYNIGFQVQCSALTATPGAAPVQGVPVAVRIDFMNGAAVVGTADTGFITGNGNSYASIQGMGTATSAFTDLRITFTPSAPVPAYLLARVKAFYCYPVMANNPVPRIDFNHIDNPDFLDGFTFWKDSTPSSVSPVTTTIGPGYTVSSGGTVTSSQIPIVAGQSLSSFWYGRNGVSGRVRWLTPGTRTNRATNPGSDAISTLTNWTPRGGTQTLGAGFVRLSITDVATGTMSQRFTYTHTTTLTAGEVISISADIRSTMVGVPYALSLNFFDSLGAAVSAVIYGPSSTPATGAWTRVTSAAVVPVGATKVNAFIGNYTAAGSRVVGDTLDVRRVLVEGGPTPAATRTNLLLNPSAEAPGGWLPNNAAASVVSRDTTVAFTAGGTSVKSITQGTATGSQLSCYAVGTAGVSVPVVNGQTYTFSVYARSSQAGYRTKAVLLAYTDGTWLSQNDGAWVSMPAANTWYRCSITWTAPATGAITVSPMADVNATTGVVPTGTAAWIDAALLETGSTLGTYFDGSTIPTGTVGGTFVHNQWSGTAHASTSTQHPVATGTFSGDYFDGSAALATWTGTPHASPSTAPNSIAGTPYVQNAVVQTGYANTVLAPAGTIAAVQEFTGPGEIAHAYAGVIFPSHEDAGRFNPRSWFYMDGTKGSDFYAQPVKWAGEVDNSLSRVYPRLTAGWVTTLSPTGRNVHAFGAAGATFGATVPPGSTGHVGGPPRLLKGETATYRTLGYAKGTSTTGEPNLFISGQIAVRHDSGCTVSIEVYGAASPTASGVLLGSYPVTTGTVGQLVRFDNLSVAAYEYVYVQVSYTENANRPGYPFRVDNLIILPSVSPLPAGDFPGYFDGSTPGGAWTDVPNNSPSQYYGGGRRCKAEVVDAIDMTSMAGGTRAEFNVEMVLPFSFWEDLLESTITAAVTSAQLNTVDPVPAKNGYDVALSALVETTAPIDDAVVTITPSGTVTNLKITDVASGAALTITGNLPGVVVVDNEKFTVKNGLTSLIANVRRQGSNQLLPITPVSSTAPPTLRFSSTGSGSISVSVKARRRYVIA